MHRDASRLKALLDSLERGIDLRYRRRAIRWKRRNLESLRKSNPRKFTAQRESLVRLFAS